MNEEKRKFFKSLALPLAFVLLLWAIHIIQILTKINLFKLGVFPRTFFGLKGIFTSPLIHSDYGHLFSNSLPLLLLGLGICYNYPTLSKRLFVIVYFFHGFLVWIFARQAFHIGASGLVYGFVAFLFFSGLIRRDNRSIALALIVTLLYGGLTWGVLPIKSEVSWEAHLFGSVVGIISAYIFRKVDPAPKYEWEEEQFEESDSQKNNF